MFNLKVKAAKIKNMRFVIKQLYIEFIIGLLDVLLSICIMLWRYGD